MVIAEPSWITPFIGDRRPPGGIQFPDDLTNTVAFAQGVEQIGDKQAELRLAHDVGVRIVGDRLGFLVIAAGLDQVFKAADGVLAGAEHGTVMAVALLHLLCKGEVGTGLACLYVAHQGGQLLR
ncbi:hypothetical protein SDC9_165051 [bioreactor metagenome]|uniref:Uncharacterized protein n=1 Tax=bioreactor metagenome TaxID=1076179 RepID=A0A645FV62_9ZZZZ